MNIPIANEINNKLYIDNAKLQEIIYYDPEPNTYSSTIPINNYKYISCIIISSIIFYVFVILYEINNNYILEKTYNSTLSDDKLFGSMNNV